MRTNDLINGLTADIGMHPERLERRLVVLGLLGLGLSACLFALVLAPRPNFGAVVATPRVAFKFVLTLTLVGVAGALISEVARPDFRRRIWLAVALPLAVLLLGAAMELAATPASAWTSLLVGANAVPCLALVSMLGLPPLALLLLALRSGAPSRPGLAGVVAGLLAGGFSATLYALHCVDDSPLFVAAWYGLGIGFVAATGAALGPKVLRW